MAENTNPNTPTIPVEEIQTQISAAVQGLIDVIVAALPVLIVIFVTIVSIYVVMTLVRRMARGR